MNEARTFSWVVSCPSSVTVIKCTYFIRTERTSFWGARKFSTLINCFAWHTLHIEGWWWFQRIWSWCTYRRKNPLLWIIACVRLMIAVREKNRIFLLKNEKEEHAHNRWFNLWSNDFWKGIFGIFFLHLRVFGVKIKLGDKIIFFGKKLQLTSWFES